MNSREIVKKIVAIRPIPEPRSQPIVFDADLVADPISFFENVYNIWLYTLKEVLQAETIDFSNVSEQEMQDVSDYLKAMGFQVYFDCVLLQTLEICFLNNQQLSSMPKCDRGMTCWICGDSVSNERKIQLAQFQEPLGFYVDFTRDKQQHLAEKHLLYIKDFPPMMCRIFTFDSDQLPSRQRQLIESNKSHRAPTLACTARLVGVDEYRAFRVSFDLVL